MKIRYITLILFPLIFSNLSAQTFGFGCLGLSGFYGGYGINTYDATGLNNNIKLIYENIPEYQGDIKFEKGSGFRFGANLIRANFESVFITAKGFYQFANEEKSFTYPGTDNQKDDYKLSTNHWGFGVDFGFPVFNFLDLKLIEGGITFYNVEIETTYYLNKDKLGSEKYKADNSQFGYYVATGLVLDIVEGYLSVEGSAIYNFMNIKGLSANNNNSFLKNSADSPVIAKGGFGAAVQLNIGFPL